MPSGSAATSDQSLSWLLAQARSAAAWIALSLGLGLMAGGVLIIQAGCMARIVQAVVMDGLPREELTAYFVVLVVAALLRAVLSWGRERAGFQAGARVRDGVRAALMAHITRLGPIHAAGRASGALTSTVMEQVEALHDFFAHYLPQLALAVAVPLAILTVVFPVSWAAGGLLLVSAPLIPLFMVLVGMGAQSISQRYFTALSRLSAHFLDALQGLPTLKLFDRAQAEAARVAETSRAYRVQTMRVLKVAFLSSAILEFFSAIAIALVAIYLGMSFLGYYDFGSWGRPLTLFGAIFILLLAPEFYLPLRELGVHYHTRAQALGAAREIRNILNTSPPRCHGDTVMDLAGGRVDLQIRGLHLTYPGSECRSLSSIDLHIPAGERIALVGESGAGKSSLLRAIVGFVQPDGGTITANGISLALLNAESRQGCFGWVGQDPILFHGTIRENIRMGRRNATQTEVQAVAEAAGVWDFARHLPAGLDTPVGERGYGLSRGQAQRIALARAWLKDAPVLLLDEPTAGLDPVNARMIMNALEKLDRNRTILMATHRLTGLRHWDRIAFMAGGRIVECGPYDRLMDDRGRFYEMTIAAQGGDDAALS